MPHKKTLESALRASFIVNIFSTFRNSTKYIESQEFKPFHHNLQVLLEGRGGAYTSTLKQYQAKADYFACACLQKNDGYNVQKTPGNLIYQVLIQILIK